MRAVVDRLQGPAPEPPGRVALGGRLRPGTGSAGRRAVVPDVAQPLPRFSGPEGDQFQAPDVTGESASVQTSKKQARDGVALHLQVHVLPAVHPFLWLRKVC